MHKTPYPVLRLGQLSTLIASGSTPPSGGEDYTTKEISNINQLIFFSFKLKRSSSVLIKLLVLTEIAIKGNGIFT